METGSGCSVVIRLGAGNRRVRRIRLRKFFGKFGSDRGFFFSGSGCHIGIAVYSAGTIGFVGLIIPHVVRMFFGTDHRRLIPLSALIGAPCFIYLMVSKSYGFGGSQ